MLHNTRTLANDHHLDTEQLERFARSNADQFGVITTRTGLAVASYDVDTFIEAARVAGVATVRPA